MTAEFLSCSFKNCERYFFEWTYLKLNYESEYVWNDEIKPLCPFRYLPGIKHIRFNKILTKPRPETFKCIVSKLVEKVFGINIPTEMVFENSDGELFEINFNGMSCEGVAIYNAIWLHGDGVGSDLIDKWFFFVGIDFKYLHYK